MHLTFKQKLPFTNHIRMCHDLPGTKECKGANFNNSINFKSRNIPAATSINITCLHSSHTVYQHSVKAQSHLLYSSQQPL